MRTARKPPLSRHKEKDESRRGGKNSLSAGNSNDSGVAPRTKRVLGASPRDFRVVGGSLQIWREGEGALDSREDDDHQGGHHLDVSSSVMLAC